MQLLWVKKYYRVSGVKAVFPALSALFPLKCRGIRGRKYISPAPPFLTLMQRTRSRGLFPSRSRRGAFAALRSPASLSFPAALSPESCHPSPMGLGSRRWRAADTFSPCSFAVLPPPAAEPCSPFTSAPRRLPRFLAGRHRRAAGSLRVVLRRVAPHSVSYTLHYTSLIPKHHTASVNWSEPRIPCRQQSAH